jgi:hypothetical protein
MFLDMGKKKSPQRVLRAAELYPTRLLYHGGNFPHLENREPG